MGICVLVCRSMSLCVCVCECACICGWVCQYRISDLSQYDPKTRNGQFGKIGKMTPPLSESACFLGPKRHPVPLTR